MQDKMFNQREEDDDSIIFSIDGFLSSVFVFRKYCLCVFLDVWERGKRDKRLISTL